MIGILEFLKLEIRQWQWQNFEIRIFDKLLGCMVLIELETSYSEPKKGKDDRYLY